ncbi:hypothetical protein HUR95_15855 [Caldalkalibacillus thermarum TA2.A1]|uniref:Zinc finger CHC2-type domain-containing protein n=1 Tax=Caldalkalibacillus thermarum (strain TA2.A1) TaxID=986075 RepID=A0A8X8I917_CALTT|nr:hypothetical protein [Caldalkalibacillus thermarum]QZT33677.1 hypothetical protein HUR95_15855 [Caldalkalibacillus thermarum TA2.A1]
MLPDIMPVAEQHGLVINERTRGKREVLAKCPFCQEDAKPGKEKKFYLSLNTEDQVFKCWFCGEAGGVFRFISLLEDVPESEVIERYRFKRGKYKPHPAERLTLHQLKLIDVNFKPHWAELRKYDKQLYFKVRQEVWERWKSFLFVERRSAFQQLYMAIETGTYSRFVANVKQREREIGVPLLEPVLDVFSREQWPTWVEEALELPREILKGGKEMCSNGLLFGI